MTELEILQMVVDSATLRKNTIKGIDPAISYALGREVKPPPIVPYYENYREMVEQYRHIEYHADAEIFPEELFAKRSPNITKDEEEYVRANYKNNTQTAFLDYVNQFSRIFHDSNWSLRYGEEPGESDDTLQDYLQYGIMEFGSLNNYMKSVGVPLKVLDPNGVIAVKPLAFRFKFNELGEQVIDESGSPQLDDTVRLEPQPVYYRVEQIVADKFGSHYLILTDEKSVVEYSGKKIQAGLVYEFYDKDFIYKISQYGKAQDLNFEIKLYLQHDWGYIPVFKFKGVAKIKRSQIMYVSPFYYATHALDACLLNAANLQTSTNNCAYPYRIMIGDPCEFDYIDKQGQHSGCRDGYVFDSVMGRDITCPGCNGTRLKSKLSSLGTMLLKPPGSTEPGDNVTATNAMAFVAPDPAILVFLREQIATDYAKATKVLHLRTKEATTAGPDPSGNNPTATGEVLDQKAQDAFIKPQSDQMFELYSNIIEAIEWQRYGRDATFSLLAPIAFDFMSQSDYLNDVANKKVAGLPPAAINASLQKLFDGIFSNDIEKSKILNLILMTDRIVSMNSNDIALQLAKGLIAPYEEILHESADYFINNLIAANPQFFEQDLETQKEQLVQAAKDKAAEIKPPTNTQNIIDTLIT